MGSMGGAVGGPAPEVQPASREVPDSSAAVEAITEDEQ